MENKEFVGVAEVMEKTGMTQSTAYRYIRELNDILKRCGCEVENGKVNRTFFLYKLSGDKTRHCKRIDFVTCLATSHGESLTGTEKHVTVLYNEEVISEKEVRKLIKKQQYEWDSRVIVTTPEAADAYCDGILPRRTGKGD